MKIQKKNLIVASLFTKTKFQKCSIWEACISVCRLMMITVVSKFDVGVNWKLSTYILMSPVAPAMLMYYLAQYMRFLVINAQSAASSVSNNYANTMRWLLLDDNKQKK